MVFRPADLSLTQSKSSLSKRHVAAYARPCCQTKMGLMLNATSIFFSSSVDPLPVSVLYDAESFRALDLFAELGVGAFNFYGHTTPLFLSYTSAISFYSHFSFLISVTPSECWKWEHYCILQNSNIYKQCAFQVNTEMIHIIGSVSFRMQTSGNSTSIVFKWDRGQCSNYMIQRGYSSVPFLQGTIQHIQKKKKHQHFETQGVSTLNMESLLLFKSSSHLYAFYARN